MFSVFGGKNIFVVAWTLMKMQYFRDGMNPHENEIFHLAQLPFHDAFLHGHENEFLWEL